MIYWQVFGWIILLFTLWCCRSPLGWKKFCEEPDYRCFINITAFVLFCFWALKAGIQEGLAIHLLGITLLTLCHGPCIAIWISLLPLIFMVLFDFLPIMDVGLYALTTVIIPVAVSYFIYCVSYRYLTHHLFVYFFISGFLNAALTMIVHLCVVSFGYWISGLHTWDIIFNNYLLLALLFWFPEGMVNGMGLTLLAVYRPHLLRTFYENEYLYQKNN